jgi:hypothetical protein
MTHIVGNIISISNINVKFESSLISVIKLIKMYACVTEDYFFIVVINYFTKNLKKLKYNLKSYNLYILYITYLIKINLKEESTVLDWRYFSSFSFLFFYFFYEVFIAFREITKKIKS